MRVLRVLRRLLGALLVTAALVVLGREAVDWYRAGDWTVIPAGQIWFELHRESLLLAQPAIERYILPELWDPVIATVLQWPAWAVLAVPGLLLAMAWGRGRPYR